MLSADELLFKVKVHETLIYLKLSSPLRTDLSLSIFHYYAALCPSLT